MTNAEKIRNLSNYELAETYINVLELRSPEGHRVSYQSKHFGQIFYVKEEAIKAEFKDGTLKVIAPKKQEDISKKIINID